LAKIESGEITQAELDGCHIPQEDIAFLAGLVNQKWTCVCGGGFHVSSGYVIEQCEMCE
jgi:hypothetical protein